MTRRPLRVALVHSFYVSRNPSGENRAVEDHTEALRRAGHEVALFASRTDDLERARTYPVRAAARVLTGRGANPLDEISEFDPDVVHVHNLFPNFGRTWVRQVEAPVVHTLHNYRPLCVNGLLLRDGAVCTSCPDGDTWAGVRHGCYRDSRVASVPLAWANRRGPIADPLLRRADRIVVLSPNQRAMLEARGVPAERLEVGANFLPDDRRPPVRAQGQGDHWLFVGRLSPEKGILRLLSHWPRDRRLVIIGDGPQRAEVEAAAAGTAIEVWGARDASEVLAAMAASTGLVFPSVWFEGAPLVYLEAMAVGLPVVAFEPSSVAAAVRASGTGAVPEWSDPSVADALEHVETHRGDLRDRALAVFEAHHTEERFCEWTVDLYRRLLDR